jgi:hypothetical protein
MDKKKFFNEGLSDKQKEVAVAALEALEDAGLNFVVMVLTDSGRGDVVSNFPPHEAIQVIEGALEKARPLLTLHRIETTEHLHGPVDNKRMEQLSRWNTKGGTN